jgi:hypothetical protein
MTHGHLAAKTKAETLKWEIGKLMAENFSFSAFTISEFSAPSSVLCPLPSDPSEGNM